MKVWLLSIKGVGKGRRGSNHEAPTTREDSTEVPAGQGIVQQSHDVLQATPALTTHRRVPGR